VYSVQYTLQYGNLALPLLACTVLYCRVLPVLPAIHYCIQYRFTECACAAPHHAFCSVKVRSSKSSTKTIRAHLSRIVTCALQYCSYFRPSHIAQAEFRLRYRATNRYPYTIHVLIYYDGLTHRLIVIVPCSLPKAVRCQRCGKYTSGTFPVTLS
jgi:hypothetical protein